MKMRQIRNILTAAFLTAAMVLTTACGSGSTSSGSTTSSGASSAGASSSGASDASSSGEDLSGEESGASSDAEETDSDYEFETVSEAEGPYQSDFNDYLEANTTANLLKAHDAVQFDVAIYTLTGADDISYSTRLSADQRYIQYSDGESWLVRDQYVDGYDSTVGAPFRSVYGSDEEQGAVSSEFDSLFSLYYDESVDEMTEDGSTVTFTSYMRQTDEISYQAGNGETDVADGAYLKRVTSFDKETKELQNSTATYEVDGADPVKVEEVSLTVDVGENEEAEELIAKLDSSDAHSVKVIVSPGTEDEKTLTSSVGKGCFFSIALGDYSYYQDEACTKEAGDDLLYDTENDITVYAVENTYDEESELTDLDGEEFEFDISSVEVEPEG